MTNQARREVVSTLVTDLRELRRRNGMPSYAELARRTGFPRSTLHDALRGDRLPALELTKAFARACGEPDEVWEKRWVEAASEVDGDRPKPSDQRSDTDQGPADRRAARSVRLPVVIAAVGLAAAGGAVAVWASTGSCVPTREYVVSQQGAVLDATGVPVGEVRAGDVVEVVSLAHDRYPHRYFAKVGRTGVNGYVDEAKLTFDTTTCR
jgi:transcriptional regulator with XRE-family HTH domain